MKLFFLVWVWGGGILPFCFFYVMGDVHWAIKNKRDNPEGGHTNTIDFAGSKISRNYFTESSNLNCYYESLIKLLEWSIQFMSFLARDICSNKGLKHRLQDVRFELPRGRFLESHFPINSLTKALHKKMSYQKNTVAALDTSIDFLVEYLLNVVNNEVLGLREVELQDPEDYYRWIQFNGNERRKILYKVKHTAASCITECSIHNRFNTVRRIYSQLEDIGKLISSRERILKRLPRQFGVEKTSKSKNDEQLEFGHRDKNAGHVGHEYAREWGKRLLSEDQLPIFKSTTIRFDGFPAVVAIDYPSMFEMTFELQVKSDFNTVVHAAIKDQGYSNDRFWIERKQLVPTQVIGYIKKRGGAIMASLPSSLQLEGTQRPIVLRAEVSAGLVCQGDNERANVASKEYLFLEVPDATLGKIPIYENELFTKGKLKTKFELVRLYAIALAKSQDGKYIPEVKGSCDISNVLSRSVLSGDLCLQFPKYFDMNDLSHTIWPTCLGLYPPGSVFFSRSVHPEAEEAWKEFERNNNEILESVVRQKKAYVEEKKAELKKIKKEQQSIQNQTLVTASHKPSAARSKKNEKNDLYKISQTSNEQSYSFETTASIGRSLKFKKSGVFQQDRYAPRPISFMDIANIYASPLNKDDLSENQQMSLFQNGNVISALPSSLKQRKEKVKKRKHARILRKVTAKKSLPRTDKSSPTVSEVKTKDSQDFPRKEELQQAEKALLQAVRLKNERLFGSQYCKRPEGDTNSLIRVGVFSEWLIAAEAQFQQCSLDRTGAILNRVTHVAAQKRADHIHNNDGYNDNDFISSQSNVGKPQIRTLDIGIFSKAKTAVTDASPESRSRGNVSSLKNGRSKQPGRPRKSGHLVGGLRSEEKKTSKQLKKR